MYNPPNFLTRRLLSYGRRPRPPALSRRRFSSSSPVSRSRIPSGLAALPARTVPRYVPDCNAPLLSLRWPSPPQNMLVVMKLFSPEALAAVVKFARYVHDDYPGTNVVVEPRVATQIQENLDLPLFVSDESARLGDTIDVVATFGGDGTVLRAASLFKHYASVPPILSFNMGTLGFLNQWDFVDYKRAWQQLYMSGSIAVVGEAALPRPHIGDYGVIGMSDPRWLSVRGKCMGSRRMSKILLRPRIKADLFDSSGNAVFSGGKGPLRAINEFSLHRGSHPHMSIIDVYLNGNFLTETMADGILVSTPTGSTAYSLSAGGPIVHPLVRTMLITAISPRSLSFRSLVLPLQSKLSLRISPKNRLRELELSVDGRRCPAVLAPGSRLDMEGEYVGQDGSQDMGWHGGVPCVMRGEDNPWEGGLNGLLKFNSPFGADLPGGGYGF
ncbi:hypothetical protein L249_1810 [Ophiocordyceps polyrhachis-furcata BCC 54312]|uniref:Uncharacterized protein n=1 Tax=Ophiocordyceps polyrhachis-furcata BCC 54312 TaxID=1330021 RepID=A0A367LPJ7_9HYPO|nr:hypothetical protein L249_1810 [Ophiocordyceps polyrhachis-furcata BCC 54312]